MIVAMYILFGLCLGGVLHSYVWYPWWIQYMADKTPVQPVHAREESLPQVSVLMAMFNEEKVVEEKIQCLLDTVYPKESIHFFLGSDGSFDSTHDLIRRFGLAPNQFTFTAFAERRGKPSVINDLAAQAFTKHPVGKDHILVITDANVMLEPTTIRQLASRYDDPIIGLVDSHVLPIGIKKEGISRSEQQYISREVQIKQAESKAWKAMMGPFGGCYSFRSIHFQPIPSHYLVDDFFLAMCVFEGGQGAINDLKALCYEAIPHTMAVEFRRKARISSGNFQNMKHFMHLWWPPFSKVGFAFFSHKILRWLGPFLMLGTWLSSGALMWLGNYWMSCVFMCINGGALLLFGIAAVGKWRTITHPFLQGLLYFFYMNVALLVGFFRYLRGIKKGTWEPTQRPHQTNDKK